MTDTPPPLPEPAGFRTRYRSEPGMIGHYPWTYADQSRRRVDRPQHESESLFTDDQVRQLLAAERERMNQHAVTLAETARVVERARWETAAKLCIEATPDQLPPALDALADVLRAA